MDDGGREEERVRVVVVVVAAVGAATISEGEAVIVNRREEDIVWWTQPRERRFINTSLGEGPAPRGEAMGGNDDDGRRPGRVGRNRPDSGGRRTVLCVCVWPNAEVEQRQ